MVGWTVVALTGTPNAARPGSRVTWETAPVAS